MVESSFIKLDVVGLSPLAVTQTEDLASSLSKEFLIIQASIECRFIMKRIRDMIRTYSQMHRTDKYSQYNSIIWPFWRKSWRFVYEVSGGVSESSSSHLNFRFGACFEKGVPWYWGKHRSWVHSETHTWHDKNIQYNAPYRQVLRTELNNLPSLGK